MKKSLSKLTAGFAAFALLLSSAGALAAAPGPATVHATLWHNYIWIDNVQAGFLNEQGKRVNPFIYNGTVYIPLRTAGEWMGCQVQWDQGTQTVSLTSGGTPYYLSIFTEAAQPEQTQEEFQQFLLDMANGIDIRLDPNISVVLDGAKQEFANAKGEAVFPILFRDSVYLPVRSIGELCGKNVLWIPSGYLTPGNPGAVFIYNTPTQRQTEEIETYTASCNGLYTNILSVFQALVSVENLSNGEALDRLSALTGLAQNLRDLSQPGALFFNGYCCPNVTSNAKELVKCAEKFVSVMSDSPAGGWNENRESFDVLFGQYMDSLHTELGVMDKFIASIRSNAVH